MNLHKLFDQFDHEGIFRNTKEIKSGHINTTFLIQTQAQETPDYILQKINSVVFKNIPELIQNKVLVCNFLRSKTKHPEQENVIRLMPSMSGDYFFIDEDKEYWNLMVFISDSQVFLKAENTKIALEAGRLFGRFFYLLNDFDAEDLSETIPRFHDMNFRFQQFEAALAASNTDRLNQAKTEIIFANELKKEMCLLQELKNTGKFPIRATHNDTKLSNALFDKNDNALSVIDLDTLMPGLVHYDFGDSVRTMCSSAEEDETNLEKVHFIPDNFMAFTEGFLYSCKSILTQSELDYLYLAPQYMTFIMGLRFLTDYLNNDIYYKINYPEHNLTRAKNQFALLKSIRLQENRMREIIDLIE